MRSRRLASLSAAALAATTFGLTACSSGSSSAGSAQSPAAAQTTTSAAATTSAAPTSSASGAATASGQTADANNASTDDIAKALQAHGVPNADRWAKEIEEYRPYTSGDMATKLGQELGKYGVDQQTLANILASLKV